MKMQAFFQQAIFQQVSKELHRRYYLKGDFGKSIGLGKYSNMEKEPLRQLLGINPIQWEKKKTVSLLELENAVQNSAINLNLEEFVSQISGDLVLKSDEIAQQDKEYNLFVDQINQTSPIFSEKLEEAQLRNWFKKGNSSVKLFEQVSKAIERLPTVYTRMPVFSYQVTGDSHAFDLENPAGRLLFQVLSNLRPEGKESSHIFSEVEEKNDILKDFFLLRDDINNYVTVRGLVGVIDNHKSQMWYHSCLEDCSWNVPLKEILKMDQIHSIHNQSILIVENSGIYSILLDKFPGLPMICSSGQFSYAVWQLLRKLEKSSQYFLYVGDLDPEGLLMAQKLIDVFPDNCQSFAMTIKNFEIAKESHNMSELRIKKLNGVQNLQLLEIAERIKVTKKIGLQEGFLNELIEEIENHYYFNK